MFIWKDTLKRCNIHAPYTDNEGTKYNKVPDHLVVEISDPLPPEDYTDKTYYRTEQEDYPYVVYTKKSVEQLTQLEKDEAMGNITQLEKETLMNRAVREFMLLSIELQAAAQNITPAQLYAANPAYKAVKDVDKQIENLRKKLK